MSYDLIDFFCGAGGSSQGAVAVPGVTVRLAANHWQRAHRADARGPVARRRQDHFGPDR